MPPLPQSIALHIGAHKTASSHLQQVLYRNRELISEHGVRVYGPGYLRRRGRDLAAMFQLSWSESPRPRRDARGQLKFLAKGRNRLVFSEENFAGSLVDSRGALQLPVYPQGPQRVQELVAKFAPIETQLFVAVRNPATFMASAYSQTLLGQTHISPVAFRAKNDWRAIDWGDYVAALREVPGIGKIFVWRQEDYDLSRRLILRRLLRWKLGPLVETVPARVNPSLSVEAVARTLERANAGETGRLAHDARRAFPVGPKYDPFRLYAAKTQAAAQEAYDAHLARIEQLPDVTVLHPPAGAHEA